MLTYEDLTSIYLRAATNLELVTHPEYWMNARSLEREFACTCHTGMCDDAENHSSCTVSFTWSTLDTALSQEGPVGVCEFFHEPDEHCPHLHTSDIPPLVLDLSYSTPLHTSSAATLSLADLTQMLKLRASENSSRANDTRPGVTLTMQDNRLLPEALTLQQRVELPIWHPDGLRGLHDEGRHRSEHFIMRRHDDDDDDDDPGEIMADDPHPEEWLPQVMLEVCQDITHVLEALDAVRSQEW
jgi:hypothetical protein